MSSTEIRRPRIIGFPAKISALAVMRLRRCCSIINDFPFGHAHSALVQPLTATYLGTGTGHASSNRCLHVEKVTKPSALSEHVDRRHCGQISGRTVEGMVGDVVKTQRSPAMQDLRLDPTFSHVRETDGVSCRRKVGRHGSRSPLLLTLVHKQYLKLHGFAYIDWFLDLHTSRRHARRQLSISVCRGRVCRHAAGLDRAHLR